MRKVVKRSDGCWEWIGKRFKNQYGSITHSNLGEFSYHLAHRISYELFVKAPPITLMVLHRCDRPWCVNPEHLFLGTAKDNSDDMVSKGRSNPARGEHSPRCKLTDQQVAEIRSRRAAGELQRVLADEFAVSAKQISIIVNFKQRKVST